jgi:2'-5' RNA ligase
MGRLFVAVWPPASLLDQLRRMDRIVRPGLRWTTEDQWHVTLRFLGTIDETAEGSTRERLASVALQVRPVEASAGPAPRRLGSGVWVLPVGGLEALAARVEAATEDIGQPAGGRPFHGHLTLARGRKPAALAGLPRPDLAARWTVEGMTLVRSNLHPAGARYEVIGRWPLGATAPAPRADPD